MNLVITKERSDLIFWNTLAFGAIQLAAVFFTYPYGIFTMVCIFGGINILWLGVWFFFVYREIRLKLHEILFDMAPFAAIAAGAIFITSLATSWLSDIYLLFGLKIIITALVYTGIMWLSGSKTFRECAEFLLKKVKRN